MQATILNNDSPSRWRDKHPAGTLDPDNLELEFRTRWGSPVRYYDDGIGTLWIMRDTTGIVGIVRAQSWEDAYSIVEDEFLPVVPEDAIHGAYGMTAEEFQAKTHAQRNEDGDWPELVEGYSYQSNATGTGIVEHDLNGELLDALTLELAEAMELQIVVKL